MSKYSYVTIVNDDNWKLVGIIPSGKSSQEKSPIKEKSQSESQQIEEAIPRLVVRRKNNVLTGFGF